MGRRKKIQLNLDVIPNRNFVSRRLIEFLESDEGKKCLSADILKSPEMKRFLENRLHTAFIYGVEAGERNKELQLKSIDKQKKKK